MEKNAKIYCCNELIRKILAGIHNMTFPDTVKDIYKYYYNMFT